MARNFKWEYKQLVRNTAPDMNKLWDKIESEIDKTDEKNKDKNNFSYQKKRRITFAKTAWTAAAAVIIIFAAVNISDLLYMGRDEDFANDSRTSVNSDSSEDLQENKAANDKVIYTQLSFNSTPTEAYNEDYTPKGDEYFTEQKVFSQTDCFANVTVKDANLTADGGEYTLYASKIIYRDGEQEDVSITLTSKTPYILQQNREYLIALKQEGDNFYLTFENAPQIEITLDGAIVFHNGWKSLCEDSLWVEKSKGGKDDFYYDRMRYSSDYDLESFIDQWRKI